MTAERRRGSLALRLAVAFVLVALIAVAVVSALTVIRAGQQTDAAVAAEHRDAARSTASALATAYRAANGWGEAQLDAGSAIAASAQARLVVADDAGHVIVTPTDQIMAEMYGAAAVEQPRGHAVSELVRVNGRAIGSATLTFPLSHDTPTQQLRDAMARTVLVGAILAAIVALVAALVVSRRLTRPLVALEGAADRLGDGDLAARADEAGPGELGELARSFNTMARTLEREAELRRQLVHDVAHELRTPLMILQGELEAMLDGIIEPDQSALTSLHDEVGRLTRLVSDLELLAAADASTLTLDRTAVDLGTVAHRVATSLSGRAHEAGDHCRADRRWRDGRG